MPSSLRPSPSSWIFGCMLFTGLLAGAAACGPATPPPAGTGGAGSGGVPASTGGVSSSGGAPSSGGVTGSGGVSSGGASGGSSSGGSSTGGSSTGGASSGGSGSGGASGGSPGSGGEAGFQPCPATGACKIVPFGDSITEGMTRVGSNYVFEGGYRVRLFELAVTADQDITFVGNAPGGNPPNGPDMVAGQPFPKAHEGMSGWTIQQLIDKETYWDVSAAADDPHIILLHIGTNDINGSQLNGAADRLETLIDQITTDLPDALLVVAKLIPLPSRTSDIDTYNTALAAIVEEKATAGKHVLLVDLNTDYPDGELPDSIHPSATGYAWMGEHWYEVIEPYLP